ncbi:EpsG family protein [Psychrilyobacter atlanticus]|uniref:EpsG family protein n=1 Tax=Psychrilyobacter atlanticus TaxID=271091 RepID=UPI00041351A3|nr:EpsG family protein [Psychrilyobacter atlanticus]
MRIKIEEVILILGTILCPLLFFPLIFLESLVNKEIKKKFIFSLGILAYLYIPTTFDDLSRIYIEYETLIIDQWVDIFNRKDFFLPLTIYLKNRFWFSKELMPFLALIVIYGSSFKIFNKLVEVKSKSKIKIIEFLFLFLLLFTNLIPRDIITKVRMPLSLGIILYSIYIRVYENKKNKAIIISIFAFTTHYSSIVYVFLCSFLGNKKIKKMIDVLFCISPLFYLLTPKLLYTLLQFLPIPSKFDRSIYTYTLGSYGIGYEKAINAKIYSYTYNLVGYFNLLYLFLFKGKSKLRPYAKGLWVFGSIFHVVNNLFFRFSFLPRILTVLVMVDEYLIENKKTKCKYEYMIFYLLVSIILFSLTLYMMRESILESWIKKCYYNIIMVFNNNIKINEFIIK